MPATVRSLARSLRLSPATVSNALSGHGRIAPETVERVKQAAIEAGYRHNPLAATLMSELRRSRGGTFRGVLAAVDILEPDRPPHGAFHSEIVAGARARAAQLGYKLQEFAVGRAGLTMQRLNSILHSRGIHGVLLLPKWHAPDTTALDWSRYAGVYTDYNVGEPVLHCMCCNHYRSMLLVLEKLTALGYKRPGLYLEQGRNERVYYRWGAAFHAFLQHHRGLQRIPPLFTPKQERTNFITWFRRYKPDVVISHFTGALDWMESVGARVPADCGFFCLNLLFGTRASAGLDQHPRELGVRSAELLIAQLQRNELGVPIGATTTTVSAGWVDGPTLRAQTK